MTSRSFIAVLAVFGVSPFAAAESPTFEISEEALNMVISHLGTLSDAGLAQPVYFGDSELVPSDFCINIGAINCPGNSSNLPGLLGPNIPLIVCRKTGAPIEVLPAGDPISWQWWISNAFVKVTDGAMTFTATVVTRVGTKWAQVTRTVDASITFSEAANRFFLDIESLRVRLEPEDPAGTVVIAPVRVAKLYNLSLGIQPQDFAVPLPSGSTREISARIDGATASYSPGLITLTLHADF